MRHAWIPVVMILLVGASGCTMTSTATRFNGLTDMDAQKITHQSTTNIAVHLLCKEPVVGDATLEQTVDDFTAEAKRSGASHVRIVQSQTTVYWWLLPPFSLAIHPVVSNVAGDTR